MAQLQSRTVRRHVAVALLCVWASLSCASETYVRADVIDGQLRIVTSRGRTIEPAKDSGQVSFSKPEISPDGRTVGWLAEFPHCCTSYPVPMKLVVQTKYRTQSFTGSGLPVWRWTFRENGSHVAFRQETVHGGQGLHYELRDVTTGRLIEAYDPATAGTQSIPRWVTALDSAQR